MAIKRLKPPATMATDYRVGGYPGLVVRVYPKKNDAVVKTFFHVYRGRHKTENRIVVKRRKLGRYETEISLAEAHEAWREDRGHLRAGFDPANVEADEKRQNEIEAARRKINTYTAAVEDYISRYQIGERGNVSAGEVRRALLREAPEWLARPVAEIAAGDVRQVLEEIRDGRRDKRRPYLSNRLYAYLRRFFAWCSEPGIDLIERSPMEGLKKPWAGEEVRERVFNDDELKALWTRSDALSKYPGAYLRVLMLTGKRKGVLARMRYDEIDEVGVWTPPQPTRRKVGNKRAHAIPLPAEALEIIEGVSDAKDDEPVPWVFFGRDGTAPLDPGTALQRKIAKAAQIGDFYFHAIRHTVETRMGKLGIAPHVRDLILDHAPQRGSGGGYDHHDYINEMHHGLGTWAAELDRIVSGRKDKKVARLGPTKAGAA
jgi:integrase